MVEAHGGTILGQSAGKDQGATFTVTSANRDGPGDRATAQTPAIEPSRTDEAESGRRNAPPRLLVVDDHHDTCTGMKMMLERRGYDITVAHTADQAVEKARQENFDLLISDIGLPDRSGYELMQELHVSKGLRGIALSGFGMEHDVNRHAQRVLPNI